jgi:hypothetical protein
MDRSAAERVVRADLDESAGIGKPLSGLAQSTQRTVEAYLKAGVRPRWMERISEIDHAIAFQKRAFGRRHRTLREECGSDRAMFARRWLAVVEAARFDELNELSDQHNDWDPIERDLPIDLRTRDYVLINGRSYRRARLDAAWILAIHPADI